MNEKLKKQYKKYDIENLSYGEVGDKLGDAYEDFIVDIFEDDEYVNNYINLKDCEVDENIFKTIMKYECIDIKHVEKIKASRKIPKRESNGNPKTDVIVSIKLKNGQDIFIPISVKQTTACKVAMAEYDVKTILVETGIENPEIEVLMKKFQKDGSAKNFTKDQEMILREELGKDNNKERLLRWILTMSPVACDTDIRVPKYIIRFDLDKNTLDIKKYKICTIDKYIEDLTTNKMGKPKKGGFGTGLSWTYATGSKGKKIQFKG
ncbi:MspI family type II restriction endonuclease [Clostridium butyricum]|uniref:MspI family type II restriction endonuclease n=1 Tax=Clostridium butyricum TaxID=1492 RepID=UPI001CA82145|nr:MspI family type II restriction endonuclease [Clostridium butyricum]MBZ0314687.1 MspI family type II restriction endonuclease [Clostridium butyricum]